MSNKKLLDDLKDEIFNSDIPNIYVDKTLIEAPVVDDNEKELQRLLVAPTSTSYIINDTIFHDDERELQKQLLEFQLYAKRAKDTIGKNQEYYDHDLYISTPGSFPDTTPDLDPTPDHNFSENSNEAPLDLTPLQFTMTKNLDGTSYIINDGLYLRWTNFHTLMYCDGETAHCAVCDEKCNIHTHIDENEHICRLEECPPLNAFDLHWYRKIREKYHCGLCNRLINIKDSEDHKRTKDHEVYQMVALYKPTDSDAHSQETKECIDDAKNMRNGSANESCHEDEYEDYMEVDEDDSYNDYYEYGSNEYEVSEGGDDPGIGGDGASYASMTKKNDIEVEMGGRKVRIKFDTYHMVTNLPQEYSFYCIVCKCSDSLKMKLKHCEDEQHLGNVNRCQVVGQYTECLVRKLDNELYHCQLCNSAQPKLHFERHMNIHRPNRCPTNEYSSDNNDTNILRRFHNFIGLPLVYSQNSVSNNGIARNNENRGRGYDNRFLKHLPGIYDMIVLKVMDCYFMVIPVMSYNFVCKREVDFYCALCDRSIGGHLKSHIYNVGHVDRLQRAEFLSEYGYNIIRVVRDILHCAICNVPIQGSAESHITDRNHQELRTKAIRSQLNKIFNIHRQPLESKTDNESLVSQRLDSNVLPVVQNNGIETTRDTEDNDDLDSTEDSEVAFDLEEYVYLKLKKEMFKILNLSYHTLVYVGDGNRYCFMCDQRVESTEIQRHVDSRRHIETIEGCMFLDKYEYHLLRQYYLEYHCAICNVIVPEKEIRRHIDWSTHVLLKADLQKHITKARKRNMDGKTRLVHVYTQPPRILTDVKQKKTKIYLNALLSKDDKVSQILPNEKLPNKKLPNEKLPNEKLPRGKLSSGLATPQSTVKVRELCKKNKIIATQTHVLQVPWESWHSVAKIKNGYKCILCQQNLQLAEIDEHCLSEWHTYALDLPICKEYLPVVLRKINESMLHCMLCNAEVENKERSILEHVSGKRHRMNLDTIISECSKLNAYQNCNPDQKDYF